MDRRPNRRRTPRVHGPVSARHVSRCPRRLLRRRRPATQTPARLTTPNRPRTPRDQNVELNQQTPADQFVEQACSRRSARLGYARQIAKAMTQLQRGSSWLLLRCEQATALLWKREPRRRCGRQLRWRLGYWWLRCSRGHELRLPCDADRPKDYLKREQHAAGHKPARQPRALLWKRSPAPTPGCSLERRFERVALGVLDRVEAQIHV